jgi:hypothetical protein
VVRKTATSVCISNAASSASTVHGDPGATASWIARSTSPGSIASTRRHASSGATRYCSTIAPYVLAAFPWLASGACIMMATIRETSALTLT